MTKSILFFMALIALSFFACKSTQSTTQNKNMPKLNWSVLKAGSMGSSEQTRTVVVKSKEEWLKEWAENSRRFEPMPPAPEVDFSKYWVIAYHLGTRSNGGYSVNVKDIQAQNGEILVSIVENAPGRNCMNTEVITHPFVYVQISHFKESKLNYKAEKEVKDCSN